MLDARAADAATLARLAGRPDEWIEHAHNHYYERLVAHRGGAADDLAYAEWSQLERALARCVRLLWLELVRRGMAEEF